MSFRTQISSSRLFTTKGTVTQKRRRRKGGGKTVDLSASFSSGLDFFFPSFSSPLFLLFLLRFIRPLGGYGKRSIAMKLLAVSWLSAAFDVEKVLIPEPSSGYLRYDLRREMTFFSTRSESSDYIQLHFEAEHYVGAIAKFAAMLVFARINKNVRCRNIRTT